MTVKELIQKLQECNEDDKVVVGNPSFRYLTEARDVKSGEFARVSKRFWDYDACEGEKLEKLVAIQ